MTLKVLDEKIKIKTTIANFMEIGKKINSIEEKLDGYYLN